jgi:transcriptional regulator with XRE-family HTH domain
MARAAVNGTRLHELRMEKRVELKDLAERAGVSVHTLSDVEAGRRLHVLERTLFSLAHALGVNASDIVKDAAHG